MQHKKIIRSIISTVLTCSIMASGASAARVIAIKNTNVYKKTSSTSNILTAMKRGTSANTIDISSSGKWAKLSINGQIGFVKLSALNIPNFSYDLQTNYKNTPYTTTSGLPSGATIASGGCGPTSVGNVLRNLCLNDDITTKNVCKLATKSGARYNGGTDIAALLKASKKKWGGFTYKYSSSYSNMKKHIKNGGMAVAHTPGSNRGSSALFSYGGHFVSITEMSNDNLVVVDPYWFENKWTANSVRRANISTTGTKGKVIVKNNAVSDACDYYYLISAK